jgi:hypothetical protein
VHPAQEGGRTELYLLCDDVGATVAALEAEGIEVARPVSDQGWGLLTLSPSPAGSSSASSASTPLRRSRFELDPPQVWSLRCGRRKSGVQVLHFASCVLVSVRLG